MNVELPETKTQRHQEDYSKHNEVHIISIEAHMLLHTRHFKPNAWINFLYKAHCLKQKIKIRDTPYSYMQNSPRNDSRANKDAIERWKFQREKKDPTLWMYNIEIDKKIDRWKVTEEERKLYN